MIIGSRACAPFLVAALLASTLACGSEGGGSSTANGPTNEPRKRVTSRAAESAKENADRVRDIQSKCAATTDEGKGIVENAKAWVPVVNGRPSDRPLRDVVALQVERGVYEVCWSATEKQNKRWKVVFNYIDIQGAFGYAEWEYDPATNEFKPFNDNSMMFWMGQL